MEINSKNTKAICFRLSDKMQTELNNIAQCHNASTSEVIRFALRSIIESELNEVERKTYAEI
jgi:predicted DNA-binding protein